ncbi:hypothetical protein Tco_0585638 [Tanacetum coccineum]
MLFYLIKNLRAPFGVLFEPKRYYNNGVYAIMLWRPRYGTLTTAIHMREVHRVPIHNFGGLPELISESLTARLTMEHHDEASVSVFTSQAWRRMLDIRGPLEEMQTAGFEVYWAESARQIPDKGDLRDYWMRISSARHFLGTTPSYTLIREPILRLCHRLIACSIAKRSQTPEKVTVTDLFYLRGMEVSSINVPYMLVRYLRLFTAVRKSGVHISEGQFVARLAGYFGLLTAKILGGLTIIAPDLPVIDMTELVRLQICVELADTWAWVAIGPERQPDAAAGAPTDVKDTLIINEGGQADLTPA